MYNLFSVRLLLFYLLFQASAQLNASGNDRVQHSQPTQFRECLPSEDLCTRPPKYTRFRKIQQCLQQIPDGPNTVLEDTNFVFLILSQGSTTKMTIARVCVFVCECEAQPLPPFRKGERKKKVDVFNL